MIAGGSGATALFVIFWKQNPVSFGWGTENSQWIWGDFHYCDSN